MLMTISTSPAPLAIALVVSNALVSVVEDPSGKPITVHTLTSGVSFNTSWAVATQAGFTQTEANLYAFASSANLTISSFRASALSSV
ncbi:hypothetical protein D3C76_1427060 [compost metagenome]